MMGNSGKDALFALIDRMIERRADGLYQARFGKTVLRSAFQPVVEVTAGGLRVCAYEALIRPFYDGRGPSAHNGHGFTVEAFFAQAPAKEALLVDRLCRALHYRNFAAFGPKDACILVNVDPAIYDDAGLAEIAAGNSLRCLTDCGLKPQQAIYEIVERPSTDERAIFTVAKQLRAAGARIAVDDFGGQALDFARLAMLRPDVVKIDGGVLHGARAGGAHLKHLSGLCRFAGRFGIDILIEGVETLADLKICRRLDPCCLQGYVFGRPVKRPLPPDVYTRRLAGLHMQAAAGLEQSAAAATA